MIHFIGVQLVLIVWDFSRDMNEHEYTVFGNTISYVNQHHQKISVGLVLESVCVCV